MLMEMVLILNHTKISYHPKKTAEWLKAWTGNNQADASILLFFGQDSTGGCAAFLIINNNKNN